MTEGFENRFEVSGIDCGKRNKVRSSKSSSFTDKNSLPTFTTLILASISEEIFQIRSFKAQMEQASIWFYLL